MELITSEVANQVCHKTMAAYNILDDGVDKLEQPRIELEGCVNRYQKNIRGEIEKGVEALAEASQQAQKEIQLSAQPGAGAMCSSSGGPGGMTVADRELLTYAAAARRNVPATHTHV
ncbi:hypothetical protein IEO21_10200 [Rhodonia placenta]|uniref:Uncharacterized protein n=1 Tax=Rhodonia placenta TaxID=104341 RepID=A0A8H7NSY7_9APHY|nr:hypothetical protein IEO21_10200 [Postia placenta]